MPLWAKSSDRWFWAYFHGPHTDEEWNHYMETVGPFLNGCPDNSVALHMMFDSKPPTPVQRDQIAGLVNEAKAAQNVAGSALVSNSMLTRGAMTVINWIARKPFPEKIHKAPGPALSWLMEQTGNDEALIAELAQSMKDDVPSAYAWRDFSAARFGATNTT